MYLQIKIKIHCKPAEQKYFWLFVISCFQVMTTVSINLKLKNRLNTENGGFTPGRRLYAFLRDYIYSPGDYIYNPAYTYV